MTLVVDRKRSWSSRRDWPAVDGRFRYVGRRSTAVRKGRAGRSSDLVRAKPRPTRKTFRDVGTGSFLSSGETATIPERTAFDTIPPSSLELSKNSACLPPSFSSTYVFHVFFSKLIIERDKIFSFSFPSFFLLREKKKRRIIRFPTIYRSRDGKMDSSW